MNKYFLLFLLVLVACSKKDDSAPLPKTTVSIRNALGVDITATRLAYVNEQALTSTLIKDIGDLSKGQTSNKIGISDTTKLKVWIFFDGDGITHFRMQGQTLLKNADNSIEILLSDGYMEVDKSSPLYPK